MLLAVSMLYVSVHLQMAFSWLGRMRSIDLSSSALCLLLLGTVLFSGSLAGNALAQWPTRLAPFGGITLILGWLLWAMDALRR